MQKINEAHLDQRWLREGWYNRRVISAICLTSRPKYHMLKVANIEIKAFFIHLFSVIVLFLLQLVYMSSHFSSLPYYPN